MADIVIKTSNLGDNVDLVADVLYRRSCIHLDKEKNVKIEDVSRKIVSLKKQVGNTMPKSGSAPKERTERQKFIDINFGFLKNYIKQAAVKLQWLQPKGNGRVMQI